MALTQGTFLNSSIQSFNANIGWGENPSSLNVQLADDDGQLFTPGALGRPIIFDYQGWQFGGVLQNWNRKGSTAGNPLYDVVIQDPREILNGVELILGGYTGPITVNNVLNVYGYLENQGFGSSRRNESGIPANLVRQAIREIMTGQTAYGGQLNILGSNIYVDIAALPTVPSYYRIPYESTTFLEFIRTICDNFNYDFFFTLNGVEGAYNLILNVVNRNFQPTFGAINTFIANAQGASVKSAGMEFANEATAKYLVGGPKTDMWLQTPSDRDTEPLQQNLWQYWGTYKNNNAAIGEGYYGDHAFTLDLRAESIDAYPEAYPTDVEEMRAVLTGQDAWQTFLEMNAYNEYKFNPAGRRTGFFKEGERPNRKLVRSRAKVEVPIKDKTGRVVNTVEKTIYSKPVPEGSTEYRALENFSGHEEFIYITYRHNNVRNPHYGKHKRLRLDSGLTLKYAAPLLYSEVDLNRHQELRPTDILNLKGNLDKNYGIEDELAYEYHAQMIDDLYGLLSYVANEYYGKQFMVRLPFVKSVREEENKQLVTSHQTTDTAFIPEEKFNIGANTNIIPVDFLDDENPEQGYKISPRLMTEDGRFYAYVRFDHKTIRQGRSKIQVRLDYSEIDPEALVYNDNYDSVFIRCEVEPNLVYANYENLEEPRAVIKLPGRVTYNPVDYSDSYYYNLVAHILYQAVRNGNKTAKEAQDEARKLVREAVASDNLNLWGSKYAVSPQMAAVPLQSNVDRYGPWHSAGVNGKTEYEQDDSLVPWNYGSYAALNTVANTRVQQAISNYQIAENGVITVPDVPNIQLGNALIQGGPYITNIKCDISTESVTTTYYMNTWKYNPYKLSKQRQDYLSRLALSDKKLEYAIQRGRLANSRGLKRQLEFQKQLAQYLKKQEKKLGTSHHILASERQGNRYVTALQPTYNSYAQYDSSYTYASLDTLLVPFNAGNLVDEDWRRPSQGGPIGIDYHPCPSGTTSYSIISDGNGNLDPSSPDFDYDTTKSFALKMPLILKGWGYDLEGNPVPSQTIISEDEDEEDIIAFRDNYTDASQWVEGPLDVRWDSTRGVWTWPTNTVYTVHKILILGNPNDGKFSLEIKLNDLEEDEFYTEEIEFDYNMTNTALVQKIIDSFDILDTIEDFQDISGGPLPSSEISFALKASTNKTLSILNYDSTNLTGGAYWTHVVIRECREVMAT